MTGKSAPRRLIVMLIVTAYLAACGRGDAASAASAQSASMRPADASGDDVRGSASDEGDRLELELAGPRFSGKHELTGDLACSTTQGMWSVVTERDVRRGVSGVMLSLQGVPASGGSTEAAWASFVFGQVTDDLDPNAGLVEVAPSAHGGDGRGSVTRDGAGAVIRIEGTSLAAGRVTAVVRCATVDISS